MGMKNWIFYIIAILFFQFGLSQSNQIEDFDSIVSYEVKKKETLYNISKKFKITVNDIYLLNPELRGQKLKKKSIISIPLKKVKKNFYLDSSINQKTTDKNKLLSPITNNENPKKNKVNLAFLAPIKIDEIEYDSINQTKEFLKKINLTTISIDFYNGMKMAIDEESNQDIKINFDVFDTKNRIDVIKKLKEKVDFNNYDFVIGPLITRNFNFFNSNNIKTQFNLDSIEASIEASVKKMMVADVDVGCFLSGGIDSSLIAAMMQKNSPKKINTFTVGFYEQNYDESIYAKKISNYLNTNHFEIKVSINDMILNIKKIIENFDEPFADSSAVPTELISSLASQKTKVILSGDGGDEIFLGYNRYIYAKKLSFFKNISPVYVRAILQKIINILPLGFLDILSTPFQKAFGIQGFSHKLIKLSNILTYENNEQFYKKLNIIDNNFLNEFLKAKENFFSKYNDTNLLESVQKNDIDNYLCNDILTKVDRSSMLNSLEVRSPFLDHLLVEKMMKIPSKLKIKNNKLKIILKDILEKYVPKAYYDRPKMGFAIPLESWFDKEKMLNLSDELIYDTEWSQLFYDDKKVKKNWENYKNFKSFPAIKIWSYLVSAIWINKNT